jgi:hypothetical protein
MDCDITLEGLNPKQMALADIMWGLEEFDAVEAFIQTLPSREQAECRSIIELMKMAVAEQCYDGSLHKAREVLRKYNTKRG